MNKIVEIFCQSKPTVFQPDDTTVEIGVICSTKCTGKEAKTPVFDNKLHNEISTYSTSTTMIPICITNIIYGIYNT